MEQSYNRTMEKFANHSEDEICSKDFPILKDRVCSDFDDKHKELKVYFSSISLEKFSLSVTNGNKYFQTQSGDIALFKQAVKINDKQIKIKVQIFKKKINFFEHPLKSSLLNIFQCITADLSAPEELMDVKEIKSKMYAIKHEKSLIFIPLLHCSG